MPPEIYTREPLIAALDRIRAHGWYNLSRNPGNSGCLGNFLEDLLGIEENNLPMPNAAEWELKTHRTTVNSRVTMFHLEPSPRALHISRHLLENFGWPRKNGTGLSFRQTLAYHARIKRGFMVTSMKREVGW